MTNEYSIIIYLKLRYSVWCLFVFSPKSLGLPKRAGNIIRCFHVIFITALSLAEPALLQEFFI